MARLNKTQVVGSLFPKVNDLVHIQAVSQDNGDADKAGKSRIADVEEDAFVIEMPIEIGSGRMRKPGIGEELSISFTTESGLRYFNTYVLGFAEDGIPLVRIQRPEQAAITKVQRRNYLRVAAELELAIELRDETRFVTYTEDVGGGGVSFKCDSFYPISEGDRMFCWLRVPFKNGLIDNVPFDAEVVRTKQLDNGRIVAMLSFITILDAERQKLVRFSFERQRLNLKDH